MKNLDELYEKYPKIFSLMSDQNHWINSHVPETWLQTIDWLCNSIQSHINNRNENNKHLPQIPQLICTQIKDKFGGLRFYYGGGDKECDGMISLAETILWDTCEHCGSHDNVQNEDSHWIRRVCQKCYNKTKKS